MSLKQKLEARNVTKRHVDLAVDNMEKVLAQTVNNASKNTTGAQAMKGNVSTFAADLEVLYGIQKEFADAEESNLKAAATRARKIEKPKEEEASVVSPAEES